MRKNFLLLCMLTAVISGASLVKADVILPTGVDEYRIIFVTSGLYTATNDDIGWYNSQVAATAALNPILDGLGADWYCVGSTEAVHARDNISPGIAWDEENVPVYNTMGEKFGDNLSNIFDKYHATPQIYDQFGTPHSGEEGYTWTGSMYKGVGWPDPWHETLGGPGWPPNWPNHTVIGRPEAPMFGTVNDWLCYGGWTELQTEHNHLYGISEPIPELATVCLLGFGGLALLRKRRA